MTSFTWQFVLDQQLILMVSASNQTCKILFKFLPRLQIKYNISSGQLKALQNMDERLTKTIL